MSSVPSDERFTPPWLLDVVREFAGGQIAVDVCAPPSNPCDAVEWWTTQGAYPYPGGRKGLTVEFSKAALDGLGASWRSDGVAWCNPPYSRGQVIRWATKAIAEGQRCAEILMLTQADVSTGWFKTLRGNCDSVCLLAKRVGFLSPDGSQMPGAKFGSAVWYFGSHPGRFDRVWAPHGWVVRGPGVGPARGHRAAAE